MKRKDKQLGESKEKLVQEYVASIPFDKRLYSYDIKGSIAHASMLAQCKVIPLEEADKIIDALQEIFRDMEAGNFEYSLADEDIHMAVEKALIDKVGPIGGKLHTARSRNDQIALDMRLYLKREIIKILDLILNLKQETLKVAQANSLVVIPGFTHLQHAQPVLLAHHLLAYFFMFKRDWERFVDCYQRTDVMPLGAGALAGTSFPLKPEIVAKQLDFSKVFDNSMDAVSDRDFVVEFLSVASLIMMHLSKLSQELILWSSQEFGFIELDEAFTTGSSIMPQKKNPDVCELVRGKTGRVFGNLIGTLTMLKALPLSYNRDLQEDKESLFDTVDTLKASLAVTSSVIVTLRINSDKLNQACQQGFITATDVADYLAKKGTPFRESHSITSKIVEKCLGKGCRLEELTLEEYKEFSSSFEKDIFDAISLKSSVKSRTSPGGTSPASIDQQMKKGKEILAQEKKWLKDNS